MAYNAVFIVDPVRSERYHLAKFVKQEHFLLMTFIAISDCFRHAKLLNCEVIVYVLRPNKTEIKHLTRIKRKYMKMKFIIVTTSDSPEVNLAELREMGFRSVQRTSDNEGVRDMVNQFLEPEETESAPEPAPAA